ncbi:TonB-dependent receptor [Sphingobium aromaticiconvertens]|uniref:TonB-dependent receptor n=1 Tax=Sphingobium aromaticiconvertens TaxID=365341 RepID=UPI003015CFE5
MFTTPKVPSSLSRKALLCVTTAGTALALSSIPALAQDSAGDSASTGGMAEIVVTARKRGENLIDVPVSITALSGDALNQRGVTGLNELNDFVPGLRYQNSSANRNDRGFQTISMRGMYPGDSPNRQAVTIFVDGVAVPGGATSGMGDIERVEVVKGPQSAYFGRSTFAGAINFITRAPSLEEVKGSVDISYSSYNSIDAKASVEGPIVQDKLAVRLAGRYYHTDGQYENVGYSGRLGERDTQSIDFSFIAKPTETTTVRGYATYWEDSDGPSAQALLTEADYNCNAGGNGRVPAGSTTGFNYICGNVGNIVPSKMAQNIDRGGSLNFGGVTNPAVGATVPADFIDHLGIERKAYQTRLMIDQEVGDHTLSAAFSHNRNRWAALTDTYNRPPDGTGYYSTVYLPYDIENNSAELRLASPDNGKFTYMVGGNYYWESIDFFTRASRGATPTNLGAPTDYRARTFGVFGSASYELLDGLKLSGEARYQWDRVNHIGYSAVTGAESANLAKTFKSFTPRVILNYEITPTVSTYASWSRGTRPGTFNTNYALFSPAIQAQLTTNAGREIPTAVDEEKLTMYEAGLKGEFFGRRLRVLSAVYYGEWRNRQINQNIAYLTGTTTSTATLTFPDGSTNLWGVELEGAFQATNDLTLEGTFNWAATDIRNVACSECVAIDGIINPVGNTMERYPEYSGTAAINYQPRINDDWTGIVRIDYIYTGKQYATAANVAWINSASRVNIRIGASTGKYTLELFGRNIFDDKTPSNVLRNTNPNGSVAQGLNTIVLAAPERATIGVRGAVRF